MKKSIETKKKFNYVFLFCAGSFAVNLYVAQMSPLAIQIMGKFGISDGQYTSLYMSNLLPSLFLWGYLDMMDIQSVLNKVC